MTRLTCNSEQITKIVDAIEALHNIDHDLSLMQFEDHHIASDAVLPELQLLRGRIDSAISKASSLCDVIRNCNRAHAAAKGGAL